MACGPEFLSKVLLEHSHAHLFVLMSIAAFEM